MHKQWNIISRDFPGLERNPAIIIPVKMTRDPGIELYTSSRNSVDKFYQIESMWYIKLGKLSNLNCLMTLIYDLDRNLTSPDCFIKQPQ